MTCRLWCMAHVVWQSQLQGSHEGGYTDIRAVPRGQGGEQSAGGIDLGSSCCFFVKQCRLDSSISTTYRFITNDFDVDVDEQTLCLR